MDFKIILVLVVGFVCGFSSGTVLDPDYLEWQQKWLDTLTIVQHDPALRKAWQKFAERSKRAPQSRVPSIPFECSPQPEQDPPDSVHRLRPADVRVVAALGDSITAGHGVNTDEGLIGLLGVLAMNRGEVWSIGGDEMLEHPVITLPNIIKKFTGPDKLRGFSFCGSLSTNLRKSGFNVAEPGARNRHMPEQAMTLIDRMLNDTTIDYENDWKVITILVGGNDLCGYCGNNDDNAPEMYTMRFRQTLDLLKKHVPRAFVNVKAMLDTSVVYNMTDDTGWCDFMHEQFCDCVMHEDSRGEMREVQLGYWYGLKSLIDGGRYDTDDDFTVVLQPHLRDQLPFKDPETGDYDLSYVSPDCFHPSLKAHQGFAFMIWNMMLTPVGQKPFQYEDEDYPTYVCPTEEHPYFFTAKNSPSAESTPTPGGTGSPRASMGTWVLAMALVAIQAVMGKL